MIIVSHVTLLSSGLCDSSLSLMCNGSVKRLSRQTQNYEGTIKKIVCSGTELSGKCFLMFGRRRKKLQKTNKY